ncbi:MAG: amidohydrolase family protein [bacterium]
MIIDCHTHWGPDFQERDECDPKPWLATLEKYGITHAVVMPTAGLFDDRRIQSDNNAVKKVCELSGGRMIPFCTVQTYSEDEALSELGRCLGRLNFAGIKFHPWLQGIFPYGAIMDKVCEVAASFSVPIVFHDGTPPNALPSQIAMLAERHPSAQFVLGHCGLFEYWREAIDVLNRRENVWGCLCGPPWAAIRELINRCDPHQLLWGSDYGFGSDDCLSYRYTLMDRPDLSNSLRQTIFCENPKRLLGL